MNVQNRISEYIRNAGIKQSVICKKTGIRTDTMSAIMTSRRKMTADEFEKICIALDKEPNDFMLSETTTKK